MKFSMRYLLVELATGIGFVGLFVLELVLNVHDWPATAPFGIAHGRRVCCTVDSSQMKARANEASCSGTPSARRGG